MMARVFLVLAFITVLLGSAWVSIKDTFYDESKLSESIALLEEKLEIVVLQQNKDNAHYGEEIKELKEEFSKLKSEKDTSSIPSIEEIEVVDGFLYEVFDGEAVITGYAGKDTYIVIPSYIDGYKVVKIGESAFANSKITAVIISEGIIEIDWFSFYSCPMLTSATIPTTVKSIGYGAFDGVSPKFTVNCSAGTYAYDFVKSYGISYILT